MARKKDKPKKLDHLLVGETDDDAALFQAAVENLDPLAIKSKLSSQEPQNTRVSSEAIPTREIDLHRCTVAEARSLIDAAIARIITTRSTVRLKIITGKGRHSGPKGPILAREIHTYIATTYANHIVSLEESPADAVLGGLPLRGHFHVVLR